ncbi:ArnT family glycosyltransferase [Terracidiphilus sp.]|jgi:4-amino-4-deoxy-L-arabinose transferase-like glycosyltransferase|uniref:ArnT family glycosyltransferase n=1 Tax=Terracidiphilus sp. TaxID=1964191 RepID=UPI003C197E2C
MSTYSTTAKSQLSNHRTASNSFVLKWLPVAALLLVYVAQCAFFIRTQSFTNDEPEHLVAGLEAWKFGEFKHWHDQPPLPRMLFALPLVGTNWQYHIADDQVRLDKPAAEVWLNRSRWVNTLLGVILLLLIWTTARRLFEDTAGLFALGLAAVSPELIAHFSLDTMDGPATLSIFLTALQFVRYRRNPTWGQAALLGCAMGVMMLSKFNCPPMIALVLALVLFRKSPGSKGWLHGWQWKRAGAVFLTAFLVVWAGYFFHVSQVTFANQMVTIHFAGYTKLLQYDMPTLQTPITIFWPACEWFTGLGQVVVHNAEGHRSFLLGQYSADGFRTYFPVAVLLKWPPIVLLAGILGVVTIALRQLARQPSALNEEASDRELLLLTVFPAVYVAFALISHINIGVRHVLPLYPFLLLYAAAAGAWLAKRRWGYVLLPLLFLAQSADTMRYAPNDLAYFTPFVSPNRTWTLLSDSNTDWGQGLYALREYQAAHPQETIHLAYVGEVDPAWMGIRYERLGEQDRPTGTVIVSATQLSGQLLANHEAYRWLLNYPLKAVLDHTMYVFEVSDGKSMMNQ